MKEPKEKAKQLFNDYYLLAESIECKVNDDLLNQFEDINELTEVKNYWHDLAKQSALMAVNEILNIRMIKQMVSGHQSGSEYDYYLEVKQEIESYEG